MSKKSSSPVTAPRYKVDRVSGKSTHGCGGGIHPRIRKADEKHRLGGALRQGGIVALVYDKRGAGKSGGEYEGEQSVREKNIALRNRGTPQP